MRWTESPTSCSGLCGDAGCTGCAPLDTRREFWLLVLGLVLLASGATVAILVIGGWL